MKNQNSAQNDPSDKNTSETKKEVGKFTDQPEFKKFEEKARERAIQFMNDPDLDHYAKEYILGSLSENTLRAYASDLKIFKFWCEDRGFIPLPASPNVVANFLAAQAKSKEPVLKASTIVRRTAAIRYLHRMADLSTLPTDAMLVRKTLKGIIREKLMAPHQKEPAISDVIQLMTDQADASTLMGLRDRALILLGFAGAFRRSELVALRIEDLKIHAEGMDVIIRKSKTDQSGEGFTKPIIRGSDHCPIRAVQAWLAASNITEGFLFRRINLSGRLWPSQNDAKKPDLCDRSVALIIKKYATLIGLNPDIYSGHSLRRGFITSGLKNGAPIEKLMAVTGQKDPKTVLRYYKDIKKYEGHAGAGLL